MATKKTTVTEEKEIVINQRWKTIKVLLEGIQPLAMQARPLYVIDALSRKDNGLPTRKYKMTDMRRFLDSMHWIDENKKPDTLDDTITDDEYKDILENLLKESKKKNEPLFYIPTEAFKESICKSTYRNGISKDLVSVRSKFMILGEKAPITFDEVIMEKVPTVNKNAKGAMVISVYSKFINWQTELNIKYNEAQISEDNLLSMIELAGQSIGVLGRRLELSFGKYGSFTIKQIKK